MQKAAAGFKKKTGRVWMNCRNQGGTAEYTGFVPRLEGWSLFLCAGLRKEFFRLTPGKEFCG